MGTCIAAMYICIIIICVAWLTVIIAMHKSKPIYNHPVYNFCRVYISVWSLSVILQHVRLCMALHALMYICGIHTTCMSMKRKVKGIDM